MIHDKQLPYKIALARKIWVANVTIGVIWATVFWETWTNVMWPGDEGTHHCPL